MFSVDSAHIFHTFLGRKAVLIFLNVNSYFAFPFVGSYESLVSQIEFAAVRHYDDDEIDANVESMLLVRMLTAE
jgi:hypothetical protein